MLMRVGADVNIADIEFEASPLMWACHLKDRRMVDTLLFNHERGCAVLL